MSNKNLKINDFILPLSMMFFCSIGMILVLIFFPSVELIYPLVFGTSIGFLLGIILMAVQSE